MMKTGKLTRIPLREVWPHEARDFSRWLAKNLDYLEECTGLSLSLIETEAITGDFAVDILAEDANGNLVVREPVRSHRPRPLGQIAHLHGQSRSKGGHLGDGSTPA